MIPARIRRMQPRGPVAAARTSLAHGLMFLWNGANPTNAVIGGRSTTSNLNKGRRIFSTIESPEFAGGQDVRWSRAVIGTNPVEATIFALCSVDTTADGQTIISLSQAGSTNPLFRLGYANSSLLGWYAQFRGATSFANVDVGSVGLSPAQKLTLVVGVYRNGARTKEIWTDGVLRRTDSTDCGTIDLDQTEIGSLVRTGAAQWMDGVVAMAGVYNRALSPFEIVELAYNPWQIFAPQPRRIFAPGAAAGGGGGSDTPITPENGSLTLLGYAPTLAQAFSITPGAGALTLTGLASTVSQGNIIVPGVGQVSLLGYAPGLVSGTILTPGAGGLELSGYQPGLISNTFLTPGEGSIDLAGYAPQIGTAGAISPANGTLTLVGYQPGVTQQTFIVPGVGTLTLSGLAPAVAGAGTLIPSEASLTLVGYQPLVTQQTFIVPGVGTLSLVSHAPLVVQNNYIVPGVGEVMFVGYAPSVGHGTVVTPGVGQLLLAGGVPSVTADSGSLNLTPGAGSLGFLGYAPAALTAVFVDGNGRVFWIPAQATEWIIPARSKRWVLAR